MYNKRNLYNHTLYFNPRFSSHPAIRRGSMYFFLNIRGLRPCLLAAAHFTDSEIRLAYGHEKVRLFIPAARRCRCRVAILWLR